MKHLAYILVILLIVSCGGEGKKRVKKPDDLITKDKMVDIIYDMSLVSAAKGVNRKLMEEQGLHPEKYVYEKHGIDSTQFAKSNEYYAFDLEAYEDIYSKVKAKLEKDKKHFTELVKIEDKERDSLEKERKKSRDSLREQRDSIDVKPKVIGQIKTVDSLKKLQIRQN